jgi:hypothetical protein
MFLQNKVMKSVVTDYHRWVAPEDEMWLHLLSSLTGSRQDVNVLSSSAMRNDIDMVIHPFLSQNKVKKSVVTDYQQWVAPEDEKLLYLLPSLTGPHQDMTVLSSSAMGK